MRKWLRAFGRFLSAPFRFIYWLISSIYRWVKNRLVGFYQFFTLEPEDTPLTQTFEKATQSPAGFFKAMLSHLTDLRGHLIRIALALFAASIIAFGYTAELLDWLAQPLGGIENLEAIDITEPIRVSMRVSLLAGFFVSLPYIGLELLLFVADGIKRRTRVLILILIPIITMLFAGGLAFAFYTMLPVAIPFLQGFVAGIETTPRPESYVRFVTAVMFWMGVAFQFPLASFLLSAMGILNPQSLLRQWRIAIVITAIISAVITPTPDPVNMMIVFIPLLVLYFLGIGTSFVARAGRRKRSNDEKG